MSKPIYEKYTKLGYRLEIERLNKELAEANNIIKSGINEELRKELDEILKCNQAQANRIYKAIEYIQDRYDGEVLTHTFDKDNVKELLDILKGSDKE